jgi:2-succinyl-5-enolpyruvyl-6-hydroxy-3-cyclohexene-1-carboxylate synthase
MPETSAKYNARLLAFLLKRHGCTQVVVAPGSRNAPLILALSADEAYTTYSVPDERAAAFTALGMAMENRAPAAVICTSGSAAANFLPAVTEAYYQQVPLIIITADRPEEVIGQGMGQTIQQKHIFGHHILAEAHLHREPGDRLSENYNQRLANETLQAANEGPVHINVPFAEPLYHKTKPGKEAFRHIAKVQTTQHVASSDLKELVQTWNSSAKIWVLTGQMNPQPEIAKALSRLQQKSSFVWLTETLSNTPAAGQINCIDRLINTISKEEHAQFAPDLVITLGGEVVSKMIKKLLQNNPPKEHWHVGEVYYPKDSFFKLSHIIGVQPQHFFEQLAEGVKPKDNTWYKQWQQKNEVKKEAHKRYLKKAPFSDLSVFDTLLKHLPQEGVLHCANSASIRYAQLFEHPPQRRHYANRGTSGIDGSTATAIGHALQTKQMVTLITGDVAFLYDSGAFWNDALPQNLKVIIVNNGGGNIFRIIKGPANLDHFERFQETQHQHNLEGVAKTFDIPWLKANNYESLEKQLKQMYAAPGLQILEVKTPRLQSPEVLADYFSYLKTHS